LAKARQDFAGNKGVWPREPKPHAAAFANRFCGVARLLLRHRAPAFNASRPATEELIAATAVSEPPLSLCREHLNSNGY